MKVLKKKIKKREIEKEKLMNIMIKLALFIYIILVDFIIIYK